MKASALSSSCAVVGAASLMTLSAASEVRSFRESRVRWAHAKKGPFLLQNRAAASSAGRSAVGRVPAVQRCFGAMDLVAGYKYPLDFSDISPQAGLNKSTVFNLVHTLVDLGMLEPPNRREGCAWLPEICSRKAGDRSLD
jgi:hypothetical protein